MKVLITNGRKVNSFALALECASFFANSGNDVTLIEGNPFVYPFAVRKKTQDKIRFAKFKDTAWLNSEKQVYRHNNEFYVIKK